MVPRRPHRNTGLRPTLSERRLHWNTLTACAAKYKDTFSFGQKVAEERRIQVTYYEPRVISDLPLVAANNWKFANKLR